MDSRRFGSKMPSTRREILSQPELLSFVPLYCRLNVEVRLRFHYKTVCRHDASSLDGRVCHAPVELGLARVGILQVGPLLARCGSQEPVCPLVSPRCVPRATAGTESVRPLKAR
jgi:hypothetical protein